MTRSTWMLALFFLLLFSPTRASAQAVPDRRIRSTEPQLLAALAQGVDRSPTLRRLVDRLNASDVVVYLMFDRTWLPNTAGHLSFLTATPGRRYLRIALDRRHTGCQRIAIIGHELQHAVEIADAPWVVDQASVASLYRTIGFASDTGRANCYDSRLAIETGLRIQREVSSAAAMAGSR